MWEHWSYYVHVSEWDKSIKSHNKCTHHLSACSPPEKTDLVELICFTEVQNTVTPNYSTWSLLCLVYRSIKSRAYCFSVTKITWHLFLCKGTPTLSFACKIIIKPLKLNRYQLPRTKSAFFARLIDVVLQRDLTKMIETILYHFALIYCRNFLHLQCSK